MKGRKLIIVGWSLSEYMAAGALALEALRGNADVLGVSRAKLCQALSDRASDYDEIFVLGVGITKNIPETAAVLGKLAKAGGKVHWISRMDFEKDAEAMRAKHGKTLGFADTCIRIKDQNLVQTAAFFFRESGLVKEPDIQARYERFCLDVPKGEAKGARKIVFTFQRLFQAAGYYHREIHDDSLCGQVVSKLHETVERGRGDVILDEPLKKKLEFFEKYGDDEIVGNAPSTVALIERIDKVANHDSANVLILGETGTGKELIAKQIHRKSHRKDGPLVVDNCACMDGELVNSLLFGHEKGAFTGADRLYRGLIEQANGGTLFLDEIGELPLATQAKLLRVLDNHKLVRVGGTDSETIDVDFRLVAATNRDLVQRIVDRKFREDLFQRLATVIIKTTPLRERPGDISMIAKYRWPRITNRQGARLTQGQLDVLKSYEYPGNVRELNNVLERANALADGKEKLEDLFKALIEEQRETMKPLVKALDAAKGGEPADLPENIDGLLHLHARRVYAAHGNNLKASARAAGVTETTFRKYLKG